MIFNSRWNSKSRGLPWFHTLLLSEHILLQLSCSLSCSFTGLLVAPQTSQASSWLRILQLLLPQPSTFFLRILQGLLPPLLSSLLKCYLSVEAICNHSMKKMALSCRYSLYTKHVLFLLIALTTAGHIIQLSVYLFISFLLPLEHGTMRARLLSAGHFCVPHI